MCGDYYCAVQNYLIDTSLTFRYLFPDDIHVKWCGIMSIWKYPISDTDIPTGHFGNTSLRPYFAEEITERMTLATLATVVRTTAISAASVASNHMISSWRDRQKIIHRSPHELRAFLCYYIHMVSSCNFYSYLITLAFSSYWGEDYWMGVWKSTIRFSG